MIQTLTQQETEKVKEYAEWLQGGKDNLEFRLSGTANWYDVQFCGLDITIWNEKSNNPEVKFKRGRMTPDQELGNPVVCTQSHNCNEHDHFEYFKPIAESLYRKYMFKKICGEVFEC